MRDLLFVDDVRSLTKAEEATWDLVIMARTGAQAVRYIRERKVSSFTEIWLDHDLGLDEDGFEHDIRHFVRVLAAQARHYETHELPIIRIVTQNDVGREWMIDQLKGVYPILPAI